MTDKLKPVRCGCGGATRRCADPITGQWFVQCRACGTVALYYNSEAEAVEAWNKAMGAKDTNVWDKFDKDTNVLCKERTAKVEKVDMPSEHNKVYKCSNCCQYTHRTSWSSPVNYCTNCGARLEWK